MKKHRLKIGTAALLIALVTAGCGGNGPAASPSSSPAESPTETAAASSAAPSAPVKLSLMHGWTGEVPMAKAFEPAIERYAADHPEVNLEVITQAGNAIKEKLVIDMAANQPPDVFLHWGLSVTEPYVKNGKVADLTDLISANGELAGRYVDGSLNPVTLGGKVYGLPIETYMHVFLVNQALFDEHGVKVPATFEELKTAVSAFKGKGLIPIAANGTSARYLIEAMHSQAVDNGELMDMFAGKKPFDARLTDASAKLVELSGMGAFPKGAETLQTLQALAFFNEKQAPMYYQSSWTIGNLVPEVVGDAKVVPFPLVSDQAVPTMTAGAGYFVYMSQAAYENEEKRQAAWELMQYLAGPEVAKDLIELAANPSPVKVSFDESKVSAPFAQVQQLQQSIDKTFESYQELVGDKTVYQELANRVLLGDLTPEGFAEEMNKLVKEHPNSVLAQ